MLACWAGGRGKWGCVSGGGGVDYPWGLGGFCPGLVAFRFKIFKGFENPQKKKAKKGLKKPPPLPLLLNFPFKFWVIRVQFFGEKKKNARHSSPPLTIPRLKKKKARKKKPQNH